MFKCKVCKEKEARIADLKSELAYLRQLHSPVIIPSSIIAEADRALDSEEPMPEESTLSEKETREALEVQLEAMRMLTGNF